MKIAYSPSITTSLFLRTILVLFVITGQQSAHQNDCADLNRSTFNKKTLIFTRTQYILRNLKLINCMKWNNNIFSFIHIQIAGNIYLKIICAAYVIFFIYDIKSADRGGRGAGWVLHTWLYLCLTTAKNTKISIMHGVWSQIWHWIQVIFYISVRHGFVDGAYGSTQ